MKKRIHQTKALSHNVHRSIFLCAVLLALVSLSACKDKHDNAELIIGKWAVESYRYQCYDHTAEQNEDVTYTPTDNNYIGYDTVEFYSDGATRWHMNDLYVQSGMYDDANRNFNWYIQGDSLIVYAGQRDNSRWRFGIKELNDKTLVVEDFHTVLPMYGHHHLDITETYKFKKSSK